MHLQLDQARKGPVHWREVVPAVAVDVRRDEALVLGSVDCEGSLTFTGPDFLLQARLRYRQRLNCNRCLTAYEEDVDLPLTFVVAVRREDASSTSDGAVDGAGARELEAEDLSALSAVDGAVDLGVLVREQVELNVPMKPICDPACRGLCPQCGTDWNRGECTCAKDQVDPRWSALETVRERLGGNLTQPLQTKLNTPERNP